MTRSIDIDSTRFIIFLLVGIYSVRLLGVLFTSVTGANPYAQADSLTYASYAADIAQAILAADTNYLTELEFASANVRVGTLFSIFWVLPGPSHLFARLASALFGTVAIYNVYVIARYYHSHRAGLYAIVPLVFYPTFVLVHSTILREAALLFGLTMAVRLAVVPPRSITRQTQVFLVSLCLLFTSIVRVYMVPILIFTFLFSLIFFMGWKATGRERIRMIVGGSLIAGISIPTIQWSLGFSLSEVLPYLNNRRLAAGRGRTAYLVDLAPESVSDIIITGWIYAVYFLYSPFPWMITRLTDTIILFESLLTILLTVATFFGIRVVLKRHPMSTGILISLLIVGVFASSLAVANIGHASRLRQSFTWILFLFGAIGIANRFQLKYGSDE